MEFKLNQNFGKIVDTKEGYALSSTEKYVVDIEVEMKEQSAIFGAFTIMGGLPAIDDYHNWLKQNNFDVNMPNPTNEFVSQFYGKKPLWQTEYSQGIVVKAKDDEDYYIVMECSKLNEGFKHSQIIVTPAGCI